MKLSSLLFESRGTKEIRCISDKTTPGPYHVGYTGAPGFAVSEARPEAKKNAPSKMSRIALLLDKILEDKSVYLATLNENAQGYAEYITEDAAGNSVVYAGIYDSGNVRWLDGKKPESRSAQLAPIYAYAVGNCPETFKQFDNCLIFNEHLNIPLTLSVALLACDSFYYEFAVNNNGEINDEEPLALEELNQLSRTKGVRPLTNNGFAPKYIGKAEGSATTAPNADWEAIRNGERFIAYDWNPEQMSKIPALKTLDKFVPSEDFYELLSMCSSCAESVLADIDAGVPNIDAIKAHYINAILVGKPGTGKTSLAYALGASLGIPVYTITNSRNTEEDNYEGKNKVIDGKITFCPTPFLEAYKNGGLIILEEFNLVSPDVIMGSIGQAIEAPFILMEDGYKEVRRHPLCFILATMNTCTQGSKEPNEAFTSRCPDVFLLDDPEREDFIKILTSGGNSREDSTKMYDAYSAILTYLNENSYEDVTLSLTMRHCLAALKAMKRGLSFKQAIKRTIVNAIGVKDINLAKEVYETVVEPMRS